MGGRDGRGPLRSAGFISLCREEPAEIVVLEQGSALTMWGIKKISSGETEAVKPARN